LAGKWKDEEEIATLLSLSPTGSIDFRFHARDLHLVLGSAKAGKPIRFRITIRRQSAWPGSWSRHRCQRYGTVTEERLYQLIRQQGFIQDRTFRIEFLAPGAQAYSFTFG
jgi:hypothetical protein